jgi:hypothetical protein
MKKVLIFGVILGLLLPAAAFAETEFSLGGYIKMDSFWDSSQQGKNMNTPIARDNDGNFHHGRMDFTAQGSRFNFTIKGPKVFGAVTTGFIEMDFDSNSDTNTSASNSYIPRLRHAMFRFNWPASELLLGQYWSMLCEWYPEAVEDTPFQVTGAPTARIPQIRFTQKFMGGWTVAALVGKANAVSGLPAGGAFISATNPYSLTSENGTAAETPQVQAKVEYAQDLWGKAAYYGKPTPFTAKVTAGWQRSVFRSGDVAGATIGGFDATSFVGQTYLNPWIVMGTVFIPVIPTQTANLAGTASLVAQWYIGQGISAFGFTGDNASGLNIVSPTNANISLLNRFGGYVQGQYYFDNQWFINVAWGISHVYGASQDLTWYYNGLNNQMNYTQQIDATLWYRPIQAIKFGLQYSWFNTHYFTNTLVGTQLSDTGNAHRVEFVGFFYF